MANRAGSRTAKAPSASPDTIFLTNHALVIAMLAGERPITTREVSAGLGIAEQTAQRIISQLCEQGYVTKTRKGRINAYRVERHVPLPLRTRSDLTIGHLLRFLNKKAVTSSTRV